MITVILWLILYHITILPSHITTHIQFHVTKISLRHVGEISTKIPFQSRTQITILYHSLLAITGMLVITCVITVAKLKWRHLYDNSWYRHLPLHRETQLERANNIWRAVHQNCCACNSIIYNSLGVRVTFTKNDGYFRRDGAVLGFRERSFSEHKIPHIVCL